MSNAQKAIEMKNELKKRGWTEDRWGHMTREVTDGVTSVKYRYKFMTRVVRFERQVKICDKNEWMLVKSYSIAKVKLKTEKRTE